MSVSLSRRRRRKESSSARQAAGPFHTPIQHARDHRAPSCGMSCGTTQHNRQTVGVASGLLSGAITRANGQGGGGAKTVVGRSS